MSTQLAAAPLPLVPAHRSADAPDVRAREENPRVRAGDQDPRVRARGRLDGSVDADALWTALQSVEDPELPLSIVDLGLLRELDVERGSVRVGLTYTSLACPCLDMIREDVAAAVTAVEGVTAVEVVDVLERWSRDDVTPAGLDLLRAVAVV